MYYIDYDGDGYGYPGVVNELCEPLTGWVANMDDCDDLDASISPDSIEICDEIDNDCNGDIDDADAGLDATNGIEIYADGDSDGFGDVALNACTLLSGYSLVDGDCDDADGAINPDAEEICDDGIDQNCDGGAPECFFSTTDMVVGTDSDHTIATSDGASYDYLGYRGVTTGDFNGDGYDDLIAGAYSDDDNGSGSGSVYMWYGSASLGTTFAAESAKIVGPSSSAYFGRVTDNAGDVNGDGIDDVLVGAYGDDTAYLVYGNTSVFTGTADISTLLTVADGATITNSSTLYYFGYDVAGVGDTNGDGYDDFLITDHGGYSYNSAAYLIHGAVSGITGSIDVATDADASIGDSGNSGTYFGYEKTSTGGDFNGDGFADIVIGAYGNDADGSNYGRAFMWTGPVSGTSDATLADVTFTATTSSGDTYLGRQSKTIGDFNGDGMEDLALGGYYYDAGAYDAGGVFIYWGATSWASTIDTVDAGVEIRGSNSSDYLHAIHALGDIDGDGLDDVGLGANGHDGGGTSAGILGLFMGNGSMAGVYDFETTYSASISGNSTYDYGGYSGAGADMDGDGEMEIYAGTYGNSSSTGAIYSFTGGGSF